MKNPLVSICCITYNHEEFISKTIESFLSQKVNFPIEIIIHDDASKDKTAEIVKSYKKKYPNLIKTILQKENVYSNKGINPYPAFVYPMARGKYIALCEGDDHWTDPYKLQKQVDYLESHPDCTLCTHATKYIYLLEGNREEISGGETSSEFYVEEALNQHPVSGHTSSLVFPKKIIDHVPEWYDKVIVGDYPLKLICTSLGYGYYINEVMSVRLRGVKGSFNERVINNPQKRIEFIEKVIEILRYFDEYTEGKYSRLIEERIKKFMKLKDIWSGKEYAELYGCVNFAQLMEKMMSYIRVNDIEKIGIFGTEFTGRMIHEYLARNHIEIEMFLDNRKYGITIGNIPVNHPRALSDNEAVLDLIINSVVGEHSEKINKQLREFNKNIKILSKSDLES
jgi:Glycosyltransferases involved in cell wall biogenesis